MLSAVYQPDQELSHLVVLPKSVSGLAADALILTSMVWSSVVFTPAFRINRHASLRGGFLAWRSRYFEVGCLLARFDFFARFRARGFLHRDVRQHSSWQHPIHRNRVTTFCGANQTQRAIPACASHQLNLVTGDNFAAREAVAFVVE
jgi:hypothetical protein